MYKIFISLFVFAFIFSCGKGPDIPLSQLEPYWTSWESYGFEGESGMFCNKQDDLVSYGFNRGTMTSISFDGNGMQVPPTKPGSKLFFETNDCEFRWINGIRIEAPERLVFLVTENGLVYESGTGSLTFADGTIRLYQ